jgi:purine-nucleoside/S-methyl-5'-thioadenosine phosphorylase / adenosine deaminase
LGEGLVGSMRDAEGDVFNAEALGNLAGFPMQFYGGAPAALAHNLDIDPADASAPSGAECFHRGFFGGKAAGEALVFIFKTLAVLALGGRVEAAEKSFAVALDGDFDAADFGDVNSEADNQGFLRKSVGADSSVVPDCDYTDRIVATKKTSPRKRGSSVGKTKLSKSKAPKAASNKNSKAKLGAKALPKASAKKLSSKDWIEQTQRGVTVLQAVAFNKLPWLVHGFSTRPGGVSEIDGEKVLNLGAVEWDKRENVEENKKRFQAATGASDLEFVSLHQIHSDVVRIFDAKPNKQCKGDALATKQVGLLLGVRTADCSPVLVVDPKKRVIAAIHAGWRGTLARIVAKTIGQMQMEFGSEPKDLLAAIGPTIGGCCYEVGTEVAADFAAKFSNASEFFDEMRTGDEPNPLQWLNMMPPGHQPPPKNVLLDLKKANKLQLLEAGVREGNIFVSELCTSCDVDRLFSYRKEGATSGRLLSVIGIR